MNGKKTSRWYEIVNGEAHIYDASSSEHSLSVSVVSVADLQYYRNNFYLRKVWNDTGCV